MVAKRIHPDLTTDDEERARRTQLMAEVNRAYEEGNEARLEAILREWESSPEAVEGDSTGARLVRTIRKIAQVKDRLQAIQIEIQNLKETDLFELKSKFEAATIDGRDLFNEMAARIDEKIQMRNSHLHDLRGQNQ
jgi:curved DNA-binding protein CbpA